MFQITVSSKKLLFRFLKKMLLPFSEQEQFLIHTYIWWNFWNKRGESTLSTGADNQIKILETLHFLSSGECWDFYTDNLLGLLKRRLFTSPKFGRKQPSSGATDTERLQREKSGIIICSGRVGRLESVSIGMSTDVASAWGTNRESRLLAEGNTLKFIFV